MLVTGHKLQNPDGSMADFVCIVDPMKGTAIFMPAEQAMGLAEDLKSLVTRLKIEVGC